MIIKKQSSLIGELVFKEVDYHTAKEVLIANHYSGKWNTSFGKINIGIFRNSELKGVASFGNLMNPTSHKKITDLGAESVIELNRLWISDDLGKNAESMLIASSIKIIKKTKPEIKFIQSFADGRLGCGTIYKASNFSYYGYTESLFFKDELTGEVFHKVPLENTKRPLGFLGKNALLLEGRLTAFKVKTYRYIYLLDKRVKPKLTSLPYPEYEKGSYTVKHVHSTSLLGRLKLMYDIIGHEYLAQKTSSYMLSLGISKIEIEESIKKQEQNKSVIWFKNDYTRSQKNIEKLHSHLDSLICGTL